jgi:hypothetical protein
MREELYADSRDELKWTVATRIATEKLQSIRWVVMFRDDIGQHGDGTEIVPNAAPAVTQFFQQERQLIQNGIQPNLRRIVPLCQQLDLAIDINLDPYPASVNRRRTYVDNEINYLNGRQQDRRDFVFVDPDNGIGYSPSNGKQFYEDHVPLVWQALRIGDTLGVVQFQHHVVNWVVHCSQNLARLIGVNPQHVLSNHWNNVCIYTVDRY